MKRILLVAFLAACGGHHHTTAAPAPAPDAAPPPPLLDQPGAAEAVSQLIDFLHAMAAIAEQRAGNCDQMGADLDELFTQTQPLFDLVHAAQQDPEAARLLVVEEKKREADISDFPPDAMEALGGCRDNPKVVDAMQRMPEIE
jgi:hypothetical protein